MQPRNGDRLNAYIQGSVWMWHQKDSQKTEYKKGVQSSGRPVLIVSNNTFNQFSPSVNCLAITSILKDNPVHVLFTLDVESHILCEQTHTIPKTELTEYKGVVSPLTLANVKAKLSLQYDMQTDRSLEILTNISNSVNLLNEKAINGFGVTAIADEMAATLVKILESFCYIKNELEKLQVPQVLNPTLGVKEDAPTIETNSTQTDASGSFETTASTGTTTNERKHGRSGYSDADIAFLTDTANSIDTVVERFGFKDKAMAYRMRSYYKRKMKKLGNDPTESSDMSGQKQSKNKAKPRGKHRTYSEDEKQFIADPANSVEDIMTMFDYKDKATAYKMRAYFRKRLSAAGSEQERASSEAIVV